ncbi:hypothetical protein SAY87_000895 [Trapa incisa]|uniref:RIN4 pathogenic type III effector avirulence factor Avr cleavage site domain-containing protein n=1 Tax=Trapa incisa TaxID=236973 RepID=A0AAN7GJL7_9MYRT|nr:hypothetical protein SAY87_000895 [Trapa incisa]
MENHSHVPEENSDVPSSDSKPPDQAPPPRDQAESNGSRGHRPVRPMHEEKTSHATDLRRSAADSTSRSTNRAKHHQVEGARPSHMRAAKGSTAFDQSVHKSPAHLQARISGRAGGSPTLERRVASNSSYMSPRPSRFDNTSRGDAMFDEDSTIPKFGDWDDKNPESADGYTQYFRIIQQGRQNGTRNAPVRPVVRNPAPRKSSKSCCFPWCWS